MCNGAGFLVFDVPVGDPNFGQLSPCVCKSEQREERQREELYRASNLQAFSTKTFDNFNQNLLASPSVFIRARQYARQPQGWLLFTGPVGTGKTHLAAAIANAAVQQGTNVLFTVVPDLLDYLRSTFGPHTESSYDDRFEMVRNVALLVLDDLGTENTTAWAREKLFQIINHRYNYAMSTVFTTNQDLDKLDERIRSRICDRVLCEAYLFKGVDVRTLGSHERYKPYR